MATRWVYRDKIGEHRLWPGERRLRVHHPPLLAQRRQVTEEGAAVSQGDLVTKEPEPACGMQLLQAAQEQPAEQLPEHANRQQEGGTGRDPALAVERDPAAGHDHVDMRMVRHRRPPSVEDGGDADARAEMARVGGDRQHRLRRRSEQQVVDRGLVVEGDVGDLGGEREDHVEVADRQQVGLACGEPLTGCAPWHLGQCRLRQLL